MKKRTEKTVEALTHGEASRKNIPTAEHESVMANEDRSPVRIAYERRNRDLDPQLVWRGKDEQNWSDLVVQAPPLFIQEKVHPKALVADLLRQSRKTDETRDHQPDLFADFNGLPSHDARTEFYQHDANWSNRMILGDSLKVMASLAEREGLRGKVQCIYLDPPYGIKFNSNFQWSTTSRDVKDGNVNHITREPEQVKAFRDTWRDGVHSYLTYLRDRLTVARDLLTESGSIFVQIGDENVHLVRSVLDEVFGTDNSVGEIAFIKTSGAGSPAIGTKTLAGVLDYILWYAKSLGEVKYRQLFREKLLGEEGTEQYRFVEACDGRREPHKGATIQTTDRAFRYDQFTSQSGAASTQEPIVVDGTRYTVAKGGWKTNATGARRLKRASRLAGLGRTLTYVRYIADFPAFPLNNMWTDTRQSGFGAPKTFVVQTAPRVIERCILMTTDPGDLVLDPTCGSGTTAYVAEQWGRCWITIDTSRVALALARARIMGARYPYYLLADSPEGQAKEAEVAGRAPAETTTSGDIRQGFVYERVPHTTLKSIAHNTEIDVIWERWQETLEPLGETLNDSLDRAWEEWEIPRKSGDPWPEEATKAWHKLQAAKAEAARAGALRALNQALHRAYTLDDVPDSPRDPWEPAPTELHAKWWEARIARQKEIDASIAAKADFEYLCDKPYEDRKTVRVAGPFTVESISPHRVLSVDENDELIDHTAKDGRDCGKPQDFANVTLEHLKTSGVQQAHKEDRIEFSSVAPWPGGLRVRRGTVRRGRRRRRRREARRDLHRARIRNGRPSGYGRRRARGGRRWLRRACRLRVQLRGPCVGVQKARQGPHPQGSDERGPPHGRRLEEHQQGEPLRHLRRARHRHSPG